MGVQGAILLSYFWKQCTNTFRSQRVKNPEKTGTIINTFETQSSPSKNAEALKATVLHAF